MESNWISTNNIHFKVLGKGPALALFHPSPNNSGMMLGLAEQLASDFTVICPDTPGYGTSPQLSKSNPNMLDYATAFNELFGSLGIDSISLYGSATGSQIAIRYGLEFPDKVNHLFLDNCAHFTDEERDAILQSYFPDLTPDLEGQYLVSLWDMVSSLFKYFPWCFKDEEHKLNGAVPPPAILHSIVKDYLIAGADYSIAYKAAFHHEKVDYIQALKVPTTVLRWEGSILKKYTDKIFDHTLPANVVGEKISADRSLRFKEIVACIKKNNTASQTFTKESITANLKIHKSDLVANVMNESSYQPDESGAYLVKAWHDLRDKALFATGSEESPDVLHKQLVAWFCEEQQSI